jgi:hypothetical protein
LGVVLGAAVLFSSCGGSGFVFVGSSADRAYFKVPNNWTAYNKQQLLVATGLDQSPDSQNAFHMLLGYDSDPAPSVDHILKPVADMRYPAVLAWVRKLGAQDRDVASLAGIRNAVYPIDQLAQNHQAEVLSGKDLALTGGIHGSELVFNISGGNYTISAGNAVFRVVQIGLLDPGTNLFYLFLLRCSADCYSQNQGLIDQIVNSFTVKER